MCIARFQLFGVCNRETGRGREEGDRERERGETVKGRETGREGERERERERQRKTGRTRGPCDSWWSWVWALPLCLL